MAMIKCKECGKEMSDHAIMCPNCGCPVKKNKHIYNEEINSFCLSGMIIGIVSFFIDFFGLVSATGLIISIIGLSKSSSGKNKCFAIIGIACSIIELILKIIQLYNLITLGY